MAVQTMDKSALKFLLDIKNSISLIEEFCVDVPHFNRYSRDAKTKSAVERQLQIIGTTIHQLKQETSFVPVPHMQEVSDIGNKICRPAPIDDQMVWTVLRTDLPQLKKEIALLLQHEE